MSFKIKYIALAVFCLATTSLVAQKKKPAAAGALSAAAFEQLKASEDTLGLFAYAVVNDSIEHERFGACRALITTLVRALKTENSFRYPFEQLKSISILVPPDSSFRIFTWQLFVNDSTYRYYGAIQLNRPDLQLFPLVDRSFEMEAVPTHEQLPPDRWYGALYYNLRQFDTPREGRRYLLFGFDSPSFFERRKILDVLSFGADGKPVFGAPVFDRPGTASNRPGEMRLALDYSAEASVRLNWDEQYKMILFDHLVAMPSPFGPGMTYVPDGSYDGLKLEKGRWKYVDKVFNDVQEEAPRPEPVLDARKGKDVLGRQAKGKAPEKKKE
jgi:hypothetical protein